MCSSILGLGGGELVGEPLKKDMISPEAVNRRRGDAGEPCGVFLLAMRGDRGRTRASPLAEEAEVLRGLRLGLGATLAKTFARACKFFRSFFSLGRAGMPCLGRMHSCFSIL